MAYANNPTTSSGSNAVDPTSAGALICTGDYRQELHLEDTSLPLYKHQATLKPLPIPPLDQSCKYYLESVRPLLTDDEFEATSKAVGEFQAEGGIGHTLQSRLLKRAEEYGDSSWLQHWWNRYSYLEYQEPNVIFVSYFFYFKDDQTARGRNQVTRAADLIRLSVDFRNELQTGVLPTETSGKAQTPLCSTAYKYMFNHCRIPGASSDSVYLYPPTSPAAERENILVIRNSKFYTFSAVYEGTKQVLSIADIEAQLTAIIALADDTPEGIPIGALTSLPRNDWAAARALLLEDPSNQSSLRAIQTAMFCVCLDDSAPVVQDDVARALWHGEAKNRWYDKSIQLIVFKNGKAGLLGEHALSDGQPVLRYANTIVDRLQALHVAGGLPSSQPTGPLGTPVQLKFSAETTALQWKIQNATLNFNNMTKAQDLKTLVFTGYGSNGIKAEMKSSPDAWVQLAFQLAYKKMFGVNRPTYEPVSMRSFRHGRTETVRSVTNESVAWCNAMVKAFGSGSSAFTRTPQEAQEILDKLRAALTTHSSNTKRAVTGDAFDRHLLGLRLCLRDGESGTLFNDPAYWGSCHWNISTSSLGGEGLDGWGFGEVVKDGIGLAYMVKKESLVFTVTSVRQFSRDYCHYLKESLLEMRALVATAEAAPTSRL